MSSPDTNVQKQRRRHRAALIGIFVAVLFGVLMFGLMSGNAIDATDDDEVIEADPANSD